MTIGLLIFSFLYCKYFYNNLRITDFYNIKRKYLKLFTDDILKNYQYITKLKISLGVKIKNLNHLEKLDTLIIYDNCDFDNGSIKDLNLKNLVLFDNPNIIDINHMTNLEELTIIGSKCGINDNGIKNLNVKYLHVGNNHRITKINHMSNLKTLIAPGHECGINDDSIKDLNLDFLNIEGNVNVSNIEHMTNLISLNAGWNPTINDNSIKKLNLKYLTASVIHILRM